MPGSGRGAPPVVRLLTLLVAALAAIVGVRGASHRSPAAPPPVTAPAVPAPRDAGPGPAAPATARAGIGFRSPERLHEHFRKHGAEFGAISEADYLRAAQALRDRAAGGEVLEAVRADGVVTRFDRSTGAFLACDADGTIRTYFRPNDGEAYFRRQARRGTT